MQAGTLAEVAGQGSEVVIKELHNGRGDSAAKIQFEENISRTTAIIGLDVAAAAAKARG